MHDRYLQILSSQNAGARCSRCCWTPSLDIQIVGFWVWIRSEFEYSAHFDVRDEYVIVIMSILTILSILGDDAHFDDDVCCGGVGWL